MDRNLLDQIALARQQGVSAALITIIDTKGSTPRKAGSKMLVYPDGRIYGTIGGGCAEADVKLKALQAIQDRHSFIYQINMVNDVAAEEGMVCGGIMQVFIQMI
jgi:xanthine dehydrogenase accessory factor